MKSLSQKCVLISLLLQLCLAVPEHIPVEQLQFGDMLSFPKCHGIYDHYAIYIDNVEILGRNDGENIFEMTRVPNGCHFRRLTGTVIRNNYLDSDRLQPQNRQDIINAINNLMNGTCGRWSLTNNCEHIATLVRYGEANSQCNQPGTPAGPFCRLFHERRQRRHGESENLSQNESAAAA